MPDSLQLWEAKMEAGGLQQGAGVGGWSVDPDTWV